MKHIQNFGDVCGQALYPLRLGYNVMSKYIFTSNLLIKYLVKDKYKNKYANELICIIYHKHGF